MAQLSLKRKPVAKEERYKQKQVRDNSPIAKSSAQPRNKKPKGWFYKLALLDFGLIFEIKM